MSDKSSEAVTDKKKESKRQILANRLRAKMPEHIGRSTHSLSIRQCVSLGRSIGISGGGQRDRKHKKRK